MKSTMVLAERPMPEGAAPAACGPLGRENGVVVRSALSDAELLAEIGRSLTAVYVDFLHQPVPRRTADVLNRIKLACQG